ncbi:uncharacterized protein LOC114842473 [Betta splendens]|uniref:Uncharacterized protein LOC114842473 n=1 Tax=Betta splendens TaxID=158456 RepID=A0A6P7KMR1_BETSP|nr:uncharacterized protein LOC114842473 [Betta splendens]
MAQKMAHPHPQSSLVFLLLMIITECKANSPDTVFVSAYKEEDKLLPCFNLTVTDPKSCYRVRIVKYDPAGGRSDVFAWPKNNQDAARVKWKHDRNGQKSLHLTDVRKSDEGLYGCEVCQAWECVLVRNVSLKVKDCKASPPVKAALGKAILLNCSVGDVSGHRGALNVSWAMLKGGMPAPVSVGSSRIKTTGASLALGSVEAADSGWYRCQVRGQSQHCYDINLLVQAHEEENDPASTVPVTTIIPTTEQAPESNSTTQSSEALTRAIVIIAGLVVSATLGLFLYFRCNRLRAAAQSQTRAAGWTSHLSEKQPGARNPPATEDLSVQTNSLYEEFENESMYTFQH